MTVAVVDGKPARKRAAQRSKPQAAGDVVDVQVAPLPDRGLEAHQLRVGGMPWAEIAQRTGYANARVAQMAARAALEHAAATLSVEARVQALMLEVDRLDVLLAAVWPKARKGDVKAIQSALLVHDKRVRLLGLDRLDPAAVDGPRTIVVSGGPDMADELRDAALAKEALRTLRGQTSTRG